MTLRAQIIDILVSGPKKLKYIIELLDEQYSTDSTGIKPVQTAVLKMLGDQTIELTADRYLKLR